MKEESPTPETPETPITEPLPVHEPNVFIINIQLDSEGNVKYMTNQEHPDFLMMLSILTSVQTDLVERKKADVLAFHQQREAAERIAAQSEGRPHNGIVLATSGTPLPPAPTGKKQAFH